MTEIGFGIIGGLLHVDVIHFGFFNFFIALSFFNILRLGLDFVVLAEFLLAKVFDEFLTAL